MSEDWTRPAFTKADVKRAGELLAQSIPDNEPNLQSATEAFRRAYNWRDSHMYPLHRVRNELKGFCRSLALGSLTAARPKRMASIRKKLARPDDFKLTDIQDLVGCRAIVPDCDALQRMLSVYLEGRSKFPVKHRDYIQKPKADGYRSHHLIAKFREDDDESPFLDFRVEIQLRTRIQHAWATAVEAVGFIRREDLKAGFGCRKWLRLFALISSECAEMEGLPIIPGTPAQRDARSKELNVLNKDLGALDIVRKYNATFKLTEEIPKTSKPFYLLQYDATRNEVKVKSFGNFLTGSGSEHDSSGRDAAFTSVLVSVDSIDRLREAYPNYFMDLEKFASILEGALSREPLSADLRLGPSYLRDLSWLKSDGSVR